MNTRDFMTVTDGNDFEWETIAKGTTKSNQRMAIISLSWYEQTGLQIALTERCLELLGHPTHVLVQVDRTGKAMAVMAAKNNDPRAYAISTQRRFNSVALGKKLGITRPGTIRIEAIKDGERLIALMPDRS